MLKTYLYVPDELERKIILTARVQNKSKAQFIREALEEGVKIIQERQTGGAEVLLEIAEMAKKYKVKGPKDGSINHDYYLWGFPKKNKRIK